MQLILYVIKRVEVDFNAAVASREGRWLAIENKPAICARTLVWIAGVRVAALGERLDADQDPQDRIVIEPIL